MRYFGASRERRRRLAGPAVPRLSNLSKGMLVPKRNYGQAKRQREASREEKKAQKMQRKLERTEPPDSSEESTESDESDAPSPS
jgi:hypothetical protein